MVDRIAEIRKSLDATRAIYELGDFLIESEVLGLVTECEFLLSRLAEAEARIAAALTEYPGDEYMDAKPHKGADVARFMAAALSVSPEPKEGK